MALSRKDFEALARELRDQLKEAKHKHNAGVEGVVNQTGHVAVVTIRESAARVAKALKATSPSFDTERFLSTVEPERNDAKTAG